MSLSRRNNLKVSYNYYSLVKFNKDLKDKVEYNKLTKTILLSEKWDTFDKENIVDNRINNIIDNFKNIIIDKINNKININKGMNEIKNINLLSSKSQWRHH